MRRSADSWLVASSPIGGAQALPEAVSPELVLVDPRLLADVRSLLPDPPDVLARPHLRTVAPETIKRSRAATGEQPPAGRPRPWSRARSVGSAAAVCVALVLTMMVDVRVQVGRTPAAADSSTGRDASPADTPALRDPGARTARPPRTQPRRGQVIPASSARRLAWGPVAGASGYRVELFHGSELRFRSDVDTPYIVIPTRWTRDGRQRSLEPGEYRWYVWPVLGAGRSARAIVQTRLVVAAD